MAASVSSHKTIRALGQGLGTEEIMTPQGCQPVYFSGDDLPKTGWEPCELHPSEKVAPGGQATKRYLQTTTITPEEAHLQRKGESWERRILEGGREGRRY